MDSFRLTLASTLSLCLALACGDDGSSSDSGETSSSETSQTTVDVTTATNDVTTMTTSPTTTESSTTTDTTTSTTDPTMGSSGSSDSTADSTGGTTFGTDSGQGNVEYSAEVFIGAFNRIMISKKNFDNDTCTRLQIANPDMGANELMINTPAGWGPELGWIEDSAADCDMLFAPNPEYALGGTGDVVWQVQNPNDFPCELSLNVTLDFDGNPMWVPLMDVMLANDVPVAGC